MTASTVKSSKVTALFVTEPATAQPARQQGGKLKVSTDTIEAATTSLDETADTILMLPMHSSQALHSLRLYNDDLDTGGTSGAIDVGLYNGPAAFTDATDGAFAANAVIDADCFASAITTLTAANTAGVEVRHESAVADIANVGKRLWECAGLDADPNRYFYIGLTVTTAMTTPAAGTISLVAQHSD